MKSPDSIVLVWLAAINAVTLLLFGFDKWLADGTGRRVSEFKLALVCALGGWPAGLLGMIMFHHKTAKWTFKLKFFLALIPFAAEAWAWWRWR